MRNQRLTIVLGVLGAISVVIGGLVIFSSDKSAAARREESPTVSVDGTALVLTKQGRGQAASTPLQVTVVEDVSQPASRDLDTGLRDFLRIEAAHGDITVRFLLRSGTSSYAAPATALWYAALHRGTPKQALSLHALLLDRQPGAGDPAPTSVELVSLAQKAGLDRRIAQAALTDGPSAADAAATDQAVAALHVTGTPAVVVGDQLLTATDGTSLADRVQRTVLQRTGEGR